MNCSECNQCTYDEKMKKLCLDLETRNLLLELIEDGIKQQIDDVEFLLDISIDSAAKRMIIKGTKMHFQCLLPEKKTI